MMQLTPFKVIAKRYQDADDHSQILLDDETFHSNFHEVVTKEYERLTNLLSLSTCSVMQSGDVYPCYDTMLESVTRNKILRMPQYESFLGIAPCDYSLFRTIHDLHHILLNVDFSYEGEYLACNMLINALSKQGASPLVRWFTRSAIIYNVALVNAGVKSDDNKVVLNNLFY